MKKSMAIMMLTFTLSLIQSAFCRDYLEDAGNVLQIALPAAALGATVYKKDLPGLIQLAEAFAATEILTEGLKYTVKETRPNGGGMSFPSGHTSAAFCGAAFIDMRYSESWGLPAYGLAAITGWSRIESENHFPWDVAAGAVIGLASNLIFTRKLHMNSVRLVPVAVYGNYGAALVCRW